MLFNSLHFLIFLPIVVVLYYLLHAKYRWLLIFVSSCYFYMAFIPKYILILFLIILIDYFSARAIEANEGKKRKLLLILSLLSNILLLGFFKYFNFFNQNLADVCSFFGYNVHSVNLNLVLPIGLSFHTFQSMSYTIEVYRKKQKAERHIGYFANYVLFFPQMVAGPIERYSSLGNELKLEQAPRYDNFSNGFRLILFGLFVKMVVADNLAPYVNEIYSAPHKFNAVEVLLAIFMFSFQIYADFYGYSTIAVGTAKLLGISIMDNFKTPYLSKSVTEFWTRWHISLSTWFRDYVYIPLGGNRTNLLHWSVTILMVFMVSGLWHGASWTFVVWGALHGLMLLIEKYASRLFNYSIKKTWTVVNVLLLFKTFCVTSFIWIFFRATDFANAKDIIKALLFNWDVDVTVLKNTLPIVYIGFLIITDVFLYNSRVDWYLGTLKLLPRWLVYSILLFALFAVSGTQKLAFIYFQF